MYKGFYVEKKCHHICEEKNKITILSHQNCPSTITSLQSRAFMMNILPRPFLLFLKRATFLYLNYLFQGKLSSFKTKLNEQQKSSPYVSKEQKLGELCPFHSSKVYQLFSVLAIFTSSCLHFLLLLSPLALSG